ncbi:MAG: hypothetical protein KUG77_08055 [Nannocystaceae bacterium]|nr:hypothetical protein [Nannocystaceae bacterium]
MEHPGREFLAGPAFAADQHRGLGGCHPLDEDLQPGDRGRPPDDAGQRGTPASGAPAGRFELLALAGTLTEGGDQMGGAYEQQQGILVVPALERFARPPLYICLLYTSDAADD